MMPVGYFFYISNLSLERSKVMNSINIIILEGRLGRDPEMRYTPSGKSVTNFPIAVNEQWSNNEEHVSWFTVYAWNGLGEVCNKYLRKGRRVLVHGRIHTDRVATDGDTTYYTKITADQVVFLDAPPTEEAVDIKEDIPF
jgi:single-strand DNA-binding protein